MICVQNLYNLGWTPAFSYLRVLLDKPPNIETPIVWGQFWYGCIINSTYSGGLPKLKSLDLGGLHSAVGRKSSSRAETGVFQPIHITCLCCYLCGLTKILVLAINKLHNGHDLRKKTFLNFGHFHGWQPFRPILRPSLKVRVLVVFFEIFLSQHVPLCIR